MREGNERGEGRGGEGERGPSEARVPPSNVFNRLDSRSAESPPRTRLGWHG